MMATATTDKDFTFDDPRLKVAVGSIEKPTFAWRGPFKNLTPFEETMMDLSRTCWIGVEGRGDGIRAEEASKPDFRFRLTDHGRARAAEPAR